MSESTWEVAVETARGTVVIRQSEFAGGVDILDPGEPIPPDRRMLVAEVDGGAVRFAPPVGYETFGAADWLKALPDALK